MDFLDGLATFVRVVEQTSLSAAARSLRRSVPAVSRQLALLERELGVVLLIRTTRSSELTERGRQFYARGLRILRDVEVACAEASTGKGTVGTLTVTVPVTVGLLQIGPRLVALRSAHPGLHLELRMEDRLADLVGEGVDVALRAGAAPPDSAGLVARKLWSWRRWVVASPSYLRRHGLPRQPDDLVRHEALIHLGAGPRGDASRWIFEHSEAQVDGPLRSNALLALRDAAVAGLGIAFLPDWLVKEAIASRQLRRVLPSFQSSEIPFFALYRVEQRGSRRIEAFLQVMREPTHSSVEGSTRRK